tara:strand:+ start:130 stop:1302 length:1173 start_codon:yes stop_codon:yes gene_type:complete
MGKGGSTSTQEIPYWLEDAAKRNLNQADRISRIGAVPMSYGPTVAAFAPMQNSSFLNTANAASAFGLDAPTGTDITGGLPAPTNYGGVSGYSAKPVFDAITGEFREDRPAQASYIDSFFINPFTGTTGINAGNVSDIGYGNTVPVGMNGQPIVGGGSDPFHGGDSVSDFLDPNNRMGMAEHMERQKKNYAAGFSDGAVGFGQAPDGGVYALGYGEGQMSPEVADRQGLRIRNKNPFDMTFGEHVGQIRSDVSNMKDQVVDDVKGVAKDGTVMCSAYCKMGYLPKEIWKLDRRYGVKVLREDPALIQGYHLWGIPTANYIQKNTLLAKTLRSVMWPIVKAWAEEMAHCMQPEKYKPNYVGKTIKLVGEPFSRLVGKIYKYQIRLSRTMKEI